MSTVNFEERESGEPANLTVENKPEQLYNCSAFLCNSLRKGLPPTLKKELVYHIRFETRDQARREIFEFIECFYNRRRMHSYLGYMSPQDFEEKCLAKAA